MKRIVRGCVVLSIIALTGLVIHAQARGGGQHKPSSRGGGGGASAREPVTQASPINLGTLMIDLLWKVGEGSPANVAPTAQVLSVAVSPFGDAVISGDADFMVKAWNIENGNFIQNLEGEESARSVRASTLVFDPQGKALAGGGCDGMWTVTDPLTETNHEACKGAHIQIWETSHWRAVQNIDRALAATFVFSPDNKFLAVAEGEVGIILFDHLHWQEGEHVSKRFLELDYDSIDYSPDGKTLASGDKKGWILLFNMQNDNMPDRIVTGQNLEIMAYSPDGKIIAAATGKNTILLIDVGKKKTIKTLEGHKDQILSLSFSPDGKLLASGSKDNTVILWDVAGKKQFKTLPGSQVAAFSRDAKYLAAGGCADPGKCSLGDVRVYKLTW